MDAINAILLNASQGKLTQNFDILPGSLSVTLEKATKSSSLLLFSKHLNNLIIASSAESRLIACLLLNVVTSNGNLKKFEKTALSWIQSLQNAINQCSELVMKEVLLASFVSLLVAADNVEGMKKQTRQLWVPKIWVIISKILPDIKLSSTYFYQGLNNLLLHFPSTAKPSKVALEAHLFSLISEDLKISATFIECLLGLQGLGKDLVGYQKLVEKTTNTLNYILDLHLQTTTEVGEERFKISRMPRFAEPAHWIELYRYTALLHALFRHLSLVTIDLNSTIAWLKRVYTSNMDAAFQRHLQTNSDSIVYSLINSPVYRFIKPSLDLRTTSLSRSSYYRVIGLMVKESLVPLKDYAALISDLITDLEAFFNQFSDESASKKRKFEDELDRSVGEMRLDTAFACSLISSLKVMIPYLAMDECDKTILSIIRGTLVFTEEDKFNDKVLPSLFKTLHLLVLFASPRIGRSTLPIITKIFARNLFNPNLEIQAISTESLLLLEQLVHPKLTPKSVQMPLQTKGQEVSNNVLSMAVEVNSDSESRPDLVSEPMSEAVEEIEEDIVLVTDADLESQIEIVTNPVVYDAIEEYAAYYPVIVDTPADTSMESKDIINEDSDDGDLSSVPEIDMRDSDSD